MNNDQFNEFRKRMLERKAKWDTNQEGAFGKKDENEIKEHLYVEPDMFDKNIGVPSRWDENNEARISNATAISEQTASKLEKDAIVIDKTGNILDEDEKKFTVAPKEEPAIDFRPLEKRKPDPINIIMDESPSPLTHQILAEHRERVEKKEFNDKLKEKAEARKTARKIIREINSNEIADAILSVCTLVCGAVAVINPSLQIPATALAKSIIDSYGMNYFNGRSVMYNELVSLAQTELKNYTRGGTYNVK